MLELAIWLYHIGTPDLAVRIVTDAATTLFLLWGIQSIVPGRTIGSPARRSGAAFYVARGAFLVQGHCEWGRTPSAPA